MKRTRIPTPRDPNASDRKAPATDTVERRAPAPADTADLQAAATATADEPAEATAARPPRTSVDSAERAVDKAFGTGKVDRATITRQAQLDAAEAVTMAGIAMESDEAADEAMKLAIIAENMGNRERAKAAKENERVARNKAKADHRAATKSAKQAYDAIKFSDPTKLGFLRVVQGLFLFHIASTLLVLILTSRDTVVYSSVNIIDWIMVTLETVAFYFFNNRFKVCRPYVLGMSAFGIASHAIFDLINGSFSLFGIIANSWIYCFLLVYFIFSDRVKAVFVNDFSTDRGVKEDESFVIERHGWPFIRNLLIYFVVFSILGHWMEAAMCQLIRLGIAQGDYDPNNTMLWRDWFYPYAMHGAAVCFIAACLYPLFIKLKTKFANPIAPYVVSYLANTLTVTVIEFFSGLVFNSRLENWDYSKLPFNFMGQICLQNALAFGVAASIIAWWVYPAMERGIARVRPAIMNIVCVITTIVGAILFSLYAIAPPQGIDLGENQARFDQEERIAEREGIMAELRLVEQLAEAAQRTADGTKYLPESEKTSIRDGMALVSDMATEIIAELEAANQQDQQVLDDFVEMGKSIEVSSTSSGTVSATSATEASSAAAETSATSVSGAVNAGANAVNPSAQEPPAEELTEETYVEEAPVEEVYVEEPVAEGYDPYAEAPAEEYQLDAA